MHWMPERSLDAAKCMGTADNKPPLHRKPCMYTRWSSVSCTCLSNGCTLIRAALAGCRCFDAITRQNAVPCEQVSHVWAEHNQAGNPYECYVIETYVTNVSAPTLS